MGHNVDSERGGTCKVINFNIATLARSKWPEETFAAVHINFMLMSAHQYAKGIIESHYLYLYIFEKTYCARQ